MRHGREARDLPASHLLSFDSLDLWVMIADTPVAIDLETIQACFIAHRNLVLSPSNSIIYH